MILSLENHCSISQQEKMASYLKTILRGILFVKHCFKCLRSCIGLQFIICKRKVSLLHLTFIYKDKLFSKCVDTSLKDLPSPEFFKNKILIKVIRQSNNLCFFCGYCFMITKLGLTPGTCNFNSWGWGHNLKF